MAITMLNTDTLELILNHFTFPELSNIRQVSKTFNDVALTLYKEKYQRTKDLSTKLYFEYLAKNRACANGYQKALCFTGFIDRFTKERCWPVLITNDLFRQNLFYRCAESHIYESYIPNYDSIHDRFRPYMFFESTKGLTVNTMRELLRYKRVKGVGRMRKKELQHHLLRPKYGSFCWNIEA